MYAEKLKHPKWQKRRLEIFQRDGWQCRRCGDDQTELVVHHKFYKPGAAPWEYPGRDLTTLCVNCHEQTHGVMASLHAGTLLDACLKRVKEPFFGNLAGVPSGFRFIDRTLGGFQRGELIVVAARPGMGKTALGLGFAWHAAAKAGISTALFSLESNDFQISTRLFCARAGMDPVRVKTGHISREDWKNMSDIMEILRAAPLFIDTSHDLLPGTIERRIRKIKAEKDLGLAIIDNLQLLGQKSDAPGIIRRFKRLAKETAIPVILLSGIDGRLEERPDKRPTLYDLRQDDIVSIADVILLLYRDEVYDKAPGNPSMGTAEIDIAKNRNGPVARSTLKFTEQTARFDEIK